MVAKLCRIDRVWGEAQARQAFSDHLERCGLAAPLRARHGVKHEFMDAG
jgi:hypothetical protein